MASDPISSNHLFSDSLRATNKSRFLDGSIRVFQPNDFIVSCDEITLQEQISNDNNHALCRAQYKNTGVNAKVVWLDERMERLGDLMVDLTALQNFRQDNITHFMGAGCRVTEAGDLQIIALTECTEQGTLRQVIQKYRQISQSGTGASTGGVVGGEHNVTNQSAHMGWAMKLCLAKDVARALAYLHKRKFIHGDIRTNNILVTQDNVAKLGDFSYLCNRLSSLSVRTSSNNMNSVEGSLFCSPELVNGMIYDTTADVYSFGMVLLELITEVPPSKNFQYRQATNNFTLCKDSLHRIAHEAGCPVALEALAYQCCTEPPIQRPSAAQCVEELDYMLIELGLKTDEWHYPHFNSANKNTASGAPPQQNNSSKSGISSQSLDNISALLPLHSTPSEMLETPLVPGTSKLDNDSMYEAAELLVSLTGSEPPSPTALSTQPAPFAQPAAVPAVGTASSRRMRDLMSFSTVDPLLQPLVDDYAEQQRQQQQQQQIGDSSYSRVPARRSSSMVRGTYTGPVLPEEVIEAIRVPSNTGDDIFDGVNDNAQEKLSMLEEKLSMLAAENLRLSSSMQQLAVRNSNGTTTPLQQQQPASEPGIVIPSKSGEEEDLEPQGSAAAAVDTDKLIVANSKYQTLLDKIAELQNDLRNIGSQQQGSLSQNKSSNNLSHSYPPVVSVSLFPDGNSSSSNSSTATAAATSLVVDNVVKPAEEVAHVDNQLAQASKTIEFLRVLLDELVEMKPSADMLQSTKDLQSPRIPSALTTEEHQQQHHQHEPLEEQQQSYMPNQKQASSQGTLSPEQRPSASAASALFSTVGATTSSDPFKEFEELEVQKQQLIIQSSRGAQDDDRGVSLSGDNYNSSTPTTTTASCNEPHSTDKQNEPHSTDKQNQRSPSIAPPRPPPPPPRQSLVQPPEESSPSATTATATTAATIDPVSAAAATSATITISATPPSATPGSAAPPSATAPPSTAAPAGTEATSEFPLTPSTIALSPDCALSSPPLPFNTPYATSDAMSLQSVQTSQNPVTDFKFTQAAPAQQPQLLSSSSIDEADTAGTLATAANAAAENFTAFEQPQLAVSCNVLLSGTNQYEQQQQQQQEAVSSAENNILSDDAPVFAASAKFLASIGMLDDAYDGTATPTATEATYHQYEGSNNKNSSNNSSNNSRSISQASSHSATRTKKRGASGASRDQQYDDTGTGSGEDDEKDGCINEELVSSNVSRNEQTGAHSGIAAAYKLTSQTAAYVMQLEPVAAAAPHVQELTSALESFLNVVNSCSRAADITDKIWENLDRKLDALEQRNQSTSIIPERGGAGGSAYCSDHDGQYFNGSEGLPSPPPSPLSTQSGGSRFFSQPGINSTYLNPRSSSPNGRAYRKKPPAPSLSPPRLQTGRKIRNSSSNSRSGGSRNRNRNAVGAGAGAAITADHNSGGGGDFMRQHLSPRRKPSLPNVFKDKNSSNNNSNTNNSSRGRMSYSKDGNRSDADDSGMSTTSRHSRSNSRSRSRSPTSFKRSPVPKAVLSTDKQIITYSFTGRGDSQVYSPERIRPE